MRATLLNSDLWWNTSLLGYQTIRVLKLVLLSRYTQVYFSVLSSKPRLLLCLFLPRMLTQV